MKHKMAAVGLTALLSCSTSLAGADYTPTLGDNSVYDITRIDSAEGSDFSLVEINDDGTSSITYYQYKIKDGAQSGEQIHDDLEGADVNNNFFGLTGDNGAAIFNRTSTLINPEWEIGNVTGDFVNNRVDGSPVNGPQGGAIYNRPAGGGTTSIGNITGDFINNTATSDSVWPSYGGAIYNSTNAVGQTASIGDITGNFIGNSATNVNNHAFGGAIYNYGYDDGTSLSPATLGVISGSFIGNHVEGTGVALGGAIYTSGNLTIASKGKNIEFAGNYAVTDGNRINNAIFMDTIIDGSTLTFDVSGGGQIWFLDQIDGGEVNGTGTGIEYDKQYSLVISGNGTTVGSGRIFFADTINNTATVTVNNAVMTMGSYDGHHGNFSQPDGGTADVTLNDGHLDLDYDGYQTLSLNSLTATGNSFLSFGADFHGGKADQLNTANLTGDYGLGAIHMDNFGNIGESVTVFADAGTTFNNLDTYTGIYNNIDYKFEQNGSELSVIFKDLVRAESIVVEEEILEVADKELNNLTGGILDNSGTTTVNKGSFSGNANDNANGGVFANHGSLTLTEVDFADNSSGKDGGAIYNDGSLGETLSGSNYSGNTAAGSGGAIYNAAAGTIGNIAGLSATNSFSNNTAGESGGAIYNDGSLASVTGFSFTGNRVAGGTLALGGAVYTSGSMLFDSDGKYIEFSGNSVENAAGETTNNAIFVNTADGAPVLTFDVSKGGGIIFADEIDGGAVNADRTGIDYDKQYSVVLKGNGSGKDAAEISFADTINNASALTADKINLTLTGASGSFGNFGSKGTDLSLNDSHLKLNYAAGEYQQLTIGNLSVTGNSYLSFGANFLKGASDSLNIAGVSGELQIYDIRFDYSGNVGDSVTLFDNAAVTINNLDSYTKIYNNLDYTFRQEGGKLVIASKNLVRAESVVEKGEILDIQATELNGKTNGILDNSGTTLMEDGRFDDNSHDGNGSVVNNKGTLVITNSAFTNNSSKGTGGAIHNAGNLTLIAEDGDITFAGNTDGSGANDIFMAAGTTLNIRLTQNGTATFDGGINGENGYTVNITGDNSGALVLDGSIQNSGSINVSNTEVRLQTDNLLNGQILALTNSRLNLANNTIGTLTLNGYRAKNAELWLDVDTANNVADVLNIKGELTGTTGLIVNMLSDVEQTADIVFANTPDDTDAKDGTFVISRLVGQPYQYNLNVIYDPSGKQWLFTNQEIEPEPETRTVAPEFVAYAGLMQASVEQTRGLHAVVAEKVAANKLFSENCCGVYDEAFDGKTLANAWVVTDYRQADSERPVDMEADIWGITGGFDIQTNAHNKIGVFAAYRQGEYDLSGKGRSFSSTIGSKIDIDSYLGGLYYRYDRSRAYLTATAFGGIQKADLKTDDGAVRTDTDGHQFGAAADAGYVFALSKTVTLEPSVGIFYTMTDYDDIRDRVGNTARFDTVNYAEAEAGIKLEKTFFFDESAAKLHLKPTFVQTFGDNDNVYIDNLPDSPALRDQTLGRIEIGGRYGFGGSFSVFGWGSYTFGSRYEATAFGAGMSFSW